MTSRFVNSKDDTVWFFFKVQCKEIFIGKFMKYQSVSLWVAQDILFNSVLESKDVSLEDLILCTFLSRMSISVVNLSLGRYLFV